ncbi:MAG: VOC family protein [Myxococcota bacterium]
MNARIDHVVLWVADPLASVAFYEQILGLAPVRRELYAEGRAPFPSVRVADDAIVDLMPLAAAPLMNAMPGAGGSAGHPVNHLCLAMARGDYDALRARLDARGIAVIQVLRDSFGARGEAPEAFYFGDPDGNVIEARYYA